MPRWDANQAIFSEIACHRGQPPTTKLKTYTINSRFRLVLTVLPALDRNCGPAVTANVPAASGVFGRRAGL
jgi:hypothetical protein